MNDEPKFEFNGMLFTWDDNKAAANWRKHKVTFRRAAEVFSDEYAIDIWDLGHNEDEDRRSIIGRTTVARYYSWCMLNVSRRTIEMFTVLFLRVLQTEGR